LVPEGTIFALFLQNPIEHVQGKTGKGVVECHLILSFVNAAEKLVSTI